MEEGNNKKKFGVIAIIVFIVILMAVFIWWKFFRKVVEPVNTNVNTTNNTNQITVNFNTNQAPVNSAVNTATPELLGITRLANIFAERFGSYNTVSDFRNLTELKPYMTATMKQWSDIYIAQQAASSSNSSYLSVISKAITTKITAQPTAVLSTVEIMMFREEEGSDINGKNSYNQKLTLELIKTGEQWLIDTATWQTR